MYVCIFLQQYRIHMDIGNPKNYLGNWIEQSYLSCIDMPAPCVIIRDAMLNFVVVLINFHEVTAVQEEVLAVERKLETTPRRWPLGLHVPERLPFQCLHVVLPQVIEVLDIIPIVIEAAKHDKFAFVAHHTMAGPSWRATFTLEFIPDVCCEVQTPQVTVPSQHIC